ncbi:hypothetical protein SAMN05216188_11861 [Lentzea xinjiangensis]|uniref:Uncharacterized protein n=1 Tax=Lentzea xinjiangensis TaxID=402600 RepID=A0A1H9TDQ1_9PSEU|nr:hypothetical protein [Lentzea xinjiangensis]SER95375.1 hypothetical protein SAMN05216188_11861 [Lentzea xinjiangensis]
MTPQTFRKKPVEIQARQLTAENVAEVAEWCGGLNVADLEWDYSQGAYYVPDGGGYVFAPFKTPGLVIRTLEGDHFAELTSFVICGVKGEFYSCKADIFAATYERI